MIKAGRFAKNQGNCLVFTSSVRINHYRPDQAKKILTKRRPILKLFKFLKKTSIVLQIEPVKGKAYETRT